MRTETNRIEYKHLLTDDLEEKAMSYGRECFRFLDNFIRITFPASGQVTEQVKRLVQKLGSDANTTNELMSDLGLKLRPTFFYDYLKPALEDRTVGNGQGDQYP